MASLLWLNSACNCWTVSCISLLSAGSLLLCQEYRRTTRKCQRYSQKWLCTLSVISQIIIDFLKLLSNFDKKYWLNALLSLFLTAYHYSHRYQSQCHSRLPDLNVPYFEWHWMSSLDTYTSASNLKPSRFSSSGYPFGAAPPGFQPGLVAWRNSLSSIPPTFPFTVYKPWPSAQGMVLAALTAEYEVLESWPFWCELLMHLCMVALWLFNKDEVCWHVLLTSLFFFYLYREDAWNVPVS